MIRRGLALIFESFVCCAIRLPGGNCRRSERMFYRWACHTTFRSRLKKDPLAYGWVRPFLVYDKALVPSLRRTPTDPMIPINEGASGVTFAIKVHPRARKDAIT